VAEAVFLKMPTHTVCTVLGSIITSAVLTVTKLV
jgi:hypothetical protein